MNIIEWMLSEKLATHWKQAQNIIAGLRLNELYAVKDYDGIKTRTRLYRDWRNSGEKSATAYEKAIAGEAAPVPLMPEVLHSQANA